LIRAFKKDENLFISGRIRFIESFRKLMHNDEKTEILIAKTIEDLKRRSEANAS